MPSTVFIAVQCCQCSTMQVKQKKKSSNKWNCAVCNQKQSVRKVFAEGFMAKDIRKFVQTFNISRKSVEEQAFFETQAPVSEEDLKHDENGDEFLANRTKKRNDWTEYLNEADHCNYTLKEQEQKEDGDDLEPKVVTELHKGVIKEPKFGKFSTGFATGASDRDYRPTFSRKNANKQFLSQDKTMRKDEATIEIKSKWDDYKKADDQMQQPTIGKAASKWNDYMPEDDDCRLHGRKRGFYLEEHSVDSLNSSILEDISNEHMVEDDIHPDFM
ncbi:hypothetical protein L6164_007444 [Bauhinia variegata]|uniref:Uncharacterized protein n=1 Tax=Bauhinia variegata TaxID=167791 RepID=A0ACB9PDU0_BAUVA|nr:hypothetical protein L6164_007444 [Bauhinia variegata]